MNVLDQEFCRLSDHDSLTFRDGCEGIFVAASPGAGKTANIGKNLAYGLLKSGVGGLVIAAKATDAPFWMDLAARCGRADDVIIFNAASGHCFDPLFYEWNRPGRGAGDLESVIDLFTTLLSIGKKEVGHAQDPYWERGSEQMMRASIRLIDLAGEPVSIASIDRVIKSFPSRPGQYEEEEWQKTSYCAAMIRAIRARADSLTPDQWSDLDVAVQFVVEKWAALDERPRSSLEMTWSGMADKFLYSPLRQLFCSGKCTFLPEQTTHQQRITVVDFSLHEYGPETGRMICTLIKLVYQRAWLRRNESEAPMPVFLWQDEFQYFITRRDNYFQQTCRSARVVVVCMTQNILNLAEELGEQQPGSKTKSFLGNLAIKIFGQQNDPETNNYAADLFGKEWRYIESFHAPGDPNSQPGIGGAKQLVHKLEPDEFSRLIKPDGVHPNCGAYVYHGGKIFAATRSPANPHGKNHLLVAFSRNI